MSESFSRHSAYVMRRSGWSEWFDMPTWPSLSWLQMQASLKMITSASMFRHLSYFLFLLWNSAKELCNQCRAALVRKTDVAGSIYFGCSQMLVLLLISGQHLLAICHGTLVKQEIQNTIRCSRIGMLGPGDPDSYCLFENQICLRARRARLMCRRRRVEPQLLSMVGEDVRETECVTKATVERCTGPNKLNTDLAYGKANR